MYLCLHMYLIHLCVCECILDREVTKESRSKTMMHIYILYFLGNSNGEKQVICIVSHNYYFGDFSSPNNKKYSIFFDLFCPYFLLDYDKTHGSTDLVYADLKFSTVL